MYEYKIKGSEHLKGKVRKIGKAIAVIVNKEWIGEEVIVIRKAELEGMDKEDIESWRKFIQGRAAIDSSNEIHSKGINADALRGLCLEYDMCHGPSSNTHCGGLSFLHFFLEKIVGLEISIAKKEWIMWQKQIEGLEKAKKMEKAKEERK